MRSRWICLALAGITLLSVDSASFALTFPFTESFASSDANWKDNASLAPTFVASGGADGGGYISTELSFDGLVAGPAIFRGHNAFDSSGDAFVGNWLSAGVGVIRAYVRHDAPVPIDYFVRIATSGNFPGVAIEQPFSVPAGPNWTLLEFNTSFSNPLLTPEAPPGQEFAFYNSALGAVGNVQIGVSLPESLTMDATAYSFDLDGVSIGVPEPTAFGMALVGLAAVGLGRGGLRSRRG